MKWVVQKQSKDRNYVAQQKQKERNVLHSHEHCTSGPRPTVKLHPLAVHRAPRCASTRHHY